MSADRILELLGCLWAEAVYHFYRLFGWMLPDVDPWGAE
jgi:hypothetical protein